VHTARKAIRKEKSEGSKVMMKGHKKTFIHAWTSMQDKGDEEEDEGCKEG
jgi:hypothetical protein